MSEDLAATCGSREHHIGDYMPLKSIGQGSHAEIILARHWLTGTKVAVKSLSKWGLTGRFEEVKSLQTLCHPNITALFEVITTGDKDILFMEHASGGDLYDHLEECGRKTEHEARPMFRQMISALHYCHAKGIVHRDLKPENILLDEDLNVKVADFGFSRDFTNYKLATVCGTFSYMAPEILEHRVYDGPKADVWSLGVILYRMVTGDELFVGDTAAEVTKEIHSKGLHLPDFMSVEIQDLLQKMLTIDPSQRPTLGDILKDTWVNLGEEKEMRPYSEPPWGYIDPRVAKIMREMGFKDQEIQESLTQKKYDRVMGTYLILRMKTAKMQGRTIQVKPCPSSDLSTSTCCRQEVETSILSSSPAHRLDSSSSPSTGGKEARKRGPPPTVEVRMSPSPAASLHSSSSSSTCIPGERVPSPRPRLPSISSSSTCIPGERVPSPRPRLPSSSSSSTCIPGERVPSPRPRLPSSSSSSTCIPGERVPSPRPRLPSSSSSSTCITGERVPSPRPRLPSISSSSTCIPGERVPSPRPRLPSSSSSSTCIPGERVPSPRPRLPSSSSSSTCIPGDRAPSPRPRLPSISSSSTCIPGERMPSPRPRLPSSSSSSTCIPGETVSSPRPRLPSISSSFTCIPGETVSSLRPSLHSSSSAYSPALEGRTTTPLPGPRCGSTTPSPALQRGPGGPPTTHSSSSSSSSSPPTSELGGGTPGSPSPPRHRRRRVACRVFRFLLKCICCRPSMKKTRVTPT